ncbi:dTDP-4-dehydrorhamnose 3,5-epimerase family protein [Chloroflexota bacterium]
MIDDAVRAEYPGTTRIHGVAVKKLVMHCDESGGLMELLRADDDIFTKFGQAYVSITYPGVIKAWHYHKLQTDYMTVIKGMSKFVLYDDRDDSPTKGVINEFFIGEQNPVMITIPPGVFHGQKPYGDSPSFIVNLPSEPFNINEPDEYRIEPFDERVPYCWDLQQG